MPEYQLSDQIAVYASIEGDLRAQPVLLLHGLGANSDSWLLQVPALVKAGFCTISPDFRGFGRSYTAQTPDIRDLAGDITRLLDLLEIESCNVVGISMGGTVALQLVLDEPTRVSRIALLNTFAHLWPIPLRTLANFLSRFMIMQIFGLPAQARSVTKAMFPNPEQTYLREALYQQIMQSDPQVYRSMMRCLMRFDVRTRLPEIKQQVLIITGAQDETVSPRTQRFLVDSIKNASQIIIPDAGHAVTGQQPELVNLALLNFFSPHINKQP